MSNDPRDTCPFCGHAITPFQSTVNGYTMFACGSPHEKYPKEGCGAIVSFRDGPGGKVGKPAFDAFRRRAGVH